MRGELENIKPQKKDNTESAAKQITNQYEESASGASTLAKRKYNKRLQQQKANQNLIFSSNIVAAPSKDFKEDQLRLLQKFPPASIFKTEITSNDDPG